MRESRSEQAREKRELAALIRRYASGLEDADRTDLMVHADSIEAEAGALDKAEAPLPQEATDAVARRETYGTLKARTDAVFDALLEVLKAMDDRVPDFDSGSVRGRDAFRTAVRIAHVSGTPEARYLVHGFGSRFELHVQLNVYRLAVVYRIPAQRDLDSMALQARFARWASGAADEGWTIGWREASDEAPHAIEVFCRAGLPIDFLQDERHQLYWITELVQMTRAFLLEARRVGVELAAA
jgi:hypothetical protein